jgi:NAD+ kinase
MRFGIIGNAKKSRLPEVLNSIIQYFLKNEIEFLVHRDLSANFKDKHIRSYCVPEKKLLSDSDIIISLGGDGTFLNTARIVGKKELPILGVNLGNLGFMAEVSPTEINAFIRKILDGNYKVYDLCVISCRNNSNKQVFGMNEIVVDKCNSIKMTEIEIFYNNESVVRFVADGIIVSTPTGSTGYSLSAGGTIISPYSKVLIITPICPHTLNFRPIIVPDDGKIEIKTLTKEKVRLTADGFSSYIIPSPAKFILSKADYNVKVVKDINRTYFQTLNNKLLWGADARQR